MEEFLDARELVRQGRSMEHGDTRIMLMEEAVRVADRSGIVQDQLFAREELIESATFGAAPEKALVAFSWCLARYEEIGNSYTRWTVLWKYKWIMNSIHCFPQISREKIEEMHLDMENHYLRSGYSLRPVYESRMHEAISRGDRKETKKQYNAWQAAPRDSIANCLACETNGQATYYFYLERYEQGLHKAAPLLGGTLKCSTIPQRTYGIVLMPLFRLGRVDEAIQYHLKGYRLIIHNRDYLNSIVEHMDFLVVTDNLERALSLFEDYLSWALSVSDQIARFNFYRSALLVLDLLGERGKKSFSLRLPQEFPLWRESREYEVSELAGWFEEAAHSLAKRFNERNGNDHFTRLIGETMQLKEIISPHPINEY
ncbi:MAG: hypothetical protein WBP93_09110 [Pyrinomonadaceae bacterium]